MEYIEIVAQIEELGVPCYMVDKAMEDISRTAWSLPVYLLRDKLLNILDDIDGVLDTIENIDPEGYDALIDELVELECEYTEKRAIVDNMIDELIALTEYRYLDKYQEITAKADQNRKKRGL